MTAGLGLHYNPASVQPVFSSCVPEPVQEPTDEGTTGSILLPIICCVTGPRMAYTGTSSRIQRRCAFSSLSCG
ncbi:hypothetical protein Ea357_200A [Erwinia phage Ea35-70]|uniref:Uncharacterized protein n=1 Tax=Erwinia phage Ea35-70 TaxID=1429768 RepID=W6ARF9_9CAUD|nr:hypothetical protein Ea357_200A [Erwinia phage Ea35-70]AHI60353.1 hypothetical protein Ea357_200A [Erwinia phage Ea35-70]